MANTVTVNGTTMQITGLDADFTLTTDTNYNSIIVKSVQFIPSAANDRMYVREGGIDAAPLFDSGPAADTTPIIKYFGEGTRMQPVIDISDCTLTTPASAAVIFDMV